LGSKQQIETYKACLVFRPTQRDKYGVLLKEFLGVASIEDALKFKLESKMASFAFFPLGLPKADLIPHAHCLLSNLMLSRTWST